MGVPWYRLTAASSMERQPPSDEFPYIIREQYVYVTNELALLAWVTHASRIENYVLLVNHEIVGADTDDVEICGTEAGGANAAGNACVKVQM